MRDEELRKWIRLAARGAAKRGRRCLDESRLAAYAEARIDGAERQRVEAHLSDCTYCLGQVGFLVDADCLGAPPSVPSRLLEAGRSRRTSWFGPIPVPNMAVVSVAVAALALVLVVETRDGASRIPGTGSGIATSFERGESAPGNLSVRNHRSIAVIPRLVEPEEGDLITGPALELRWEAAPSALHYTVQIVDSDGDVVWEARTEEDRIVLPEQVHLEPEQQYFAWVLAYLPSGATVKSVGVGFRMAPD